MQTDITQFKKYWEHFSAQVSLDDLASQTLYQLLLDAYTEPQRA